MAQGRLCDLLRKAWGAHGCAALADWTGRPRPLCCKMEQTARVAPAASSPWEITELELPALAPKLWPCGSAPCSRPRN